MRPVAAYAPPQEATGHIVTSRIGALLARLALQSVENLAHPAWAHP